jgi:hypothetical protein
MWSTTTVATWSNINYDNCMSTYSLNPLTEPPFEQEEKASMEEEKQEKQGKQESKCDSSAPPSLVSNH